MRTHLTRGCGACAVRFSERIDVCPRCKRPSTDAASASESVDVSELASLAASPRVYKAIAGAIALAASVATLGVAALSSRGAFHALHPAGAPVTASQVVASLTLAGFAAAAAAAVFTGLGTLAYAPFAMLRSSVLERERRARGRPPLVTDARAMCREARAPRRQHRGGNAARPGSPRVSVRGASARASGASLTSLTSLARRVYAAADAWSASVPILGRYSLGFRVIPLIAFAVAIDVGLGIANAPTKPGRPPAGSAAWLSPLVPLAGAGVTMVGVAGVLALLGLIIEFEIAFAAEFVGYLRASPALFGGGGDDALIDAPSSPPEARRVRGVVRALEAPLVAPLGGAPCVAFGVVSLDARRTLDDAWCAPFAIEDGDSRTLFVIARDVVVELDGVPASAEALARAPGARSGRASARVRELARARSSTLPAGTRVAQIAVVEGDVVEIEAALREVRDASFDTFRAHGVRRELVQFATRPLVIRKANPR